MNKRDEKKLNQAIEDRYEIASNVMTTQLNNMLMGFSRNFKTATDKMSEGIKTLIEAQQKTSVTLEEFSQSITKSLKDLSLRSSVESLNQSLKTTVDSLVPSHSKLTKALSAVKVKPYASTPMTPDLNLESAVTPTERSKDSIWQSIKDGSLKGALRGLIYEIREYKSVIALTTVTLAALNREAKLNELRTFTDGLLPGTASLDAFNSAVARVAVSTGLAYDEIAGRGANLKKYLGLEFTDDEFEGFLKTQSKLTKATGISDDTLNKMFMTIRVGTKNKQAWLDMTKNMTTALMGMSGKTGITTQSMEEFTESMTGLLSEMKLFNAPEEALNKAMTIWTNTFKSYSEVGIPELSNKLRDAITNYNDIGNDAGRLMLSRLGVTKRDVDEALQTGEFKPLLEKAISELDKMAKEIVNNPEYAGAAKLFFTENFGADAMRKIAAAQKSGDIKRALKDILQFGHILGDPGIAEQNFQAIQKSVSTSLNSIKESFQSLLTTIGDAPLRVLSSALSHVSGVVRDLHDWFSKLPGPTKDFISISTTLGLALSALVPVFGALSIAAAGLGPVGLAISGLSIVIAGLGTALALLLAKWDSVKEFMSNIGLGKLAEDLESLGKGFKGIWDSVKDWWNTSTESPFLRGILDWAKSLANVIIDIIPLFKFIKMLGEVGTKGITEGIKNRVESAWIDVKDWFWKGNGSEISPDSIARKSQLDNRYEELKQLNLNKDSLSRLNIPLKDQLKKAGNWDRVPKPEISRGESLIPQKLESNAEELKDLKANNEKIIQELKQNQPVAPTPVETPLTSNEVEVTDFDKLLSLVSQALTMYQEDRGKATLTQTYGNLPLTRSEAVHHVDQMTSDQWSWGTI